MDSINTMRKMTGKISRIILHMLRTNSMGEIRIVHTGNM